jgi:uncharacterized protein (DUF427 family)
MERESVWDYPRPPRLEPCAKRIQIVLAGQTIAQTNNAMRVLETSHPPVYYIPQQDIAMQFFTLISASSFCEWKGKASYWNIDIADKHVDRAAWSYANPTPPFVLIKDFLGFYANKMDSCSIDGEVVSPQPGNFYGGWVTKNLVGPFKGETGSEGW